MLQGPKTVLQCQPVSKNTSDVATSCIHAALFTLYVYLYFKQNCQFTFLIFLLKNNKTWHFLNYARSCLTHYMHLSFHCLQNMCSNTKECAQVDCIVITFAAILLSVLKINVSTFCLSYIYNFLLFHLFNSLLKETIRKNQIGYYIFEKSYK